MPIEKSEQNESNTSNVYKSNKYIYDIYLLHPILLLSILIYQISNIVIAIAFVAIMYVFLYKQKSKTFIEFKDSQKEFIYTPNYSFKQKTILYNDIVFVVKELNKHWSYGLQIVTRNNDRIIIPFKISDLSEIENRLRIIASYSSKTLADEMKTQQDKKEQYYKDVFNESETSK